MKAKGRGQKAEGQMELWPAESRMEKLMVSFRELGRTVAQCQARGLRVCAMKVLWKTGEYELTVRSLA